MFGHTEDMCEEFFDDEKVRLAIEGFVEGEDGAGAFEAVSGEVEFRHGVNCSNKGVSSSMLEIIALGHRGIGKELARTIL